jgi:hypothetical protein
VQFRWRVTEYFRNISHTAETTYRLLHVVFGEFRRRRVVACCTLSSSLIKTSRFTATKAYSKEKEEEGLKDVRKGREEKTCINEKFSTSGMFNTTPGESMDSELKDNRNLAQRYVGQWDSGRNHMVWTSLKEGEEVLLERGPKSATYFPRVESRSDS